MIIDTEQARLLVVSDLHVGNPFSTASSKLEAFFAYAREQRANVCINGDGFEILQARFSTLASESVGVLRAIRSLLDTGLEVFYVVGNHDIALENFFTVISGLTLTPFLNVTSGGRRIRIEHGHLYDPSFVRSPRAYEFLTRAAGPLLHLYPDVYRLWTSYETVRHRMRAALAGRARATSVYQEAAQMLANRGFDVVVFGHTHRTEDVTFESGRRYLNCGNWVRGGTYVDIDAGRVALERWGSA